MCIHRRRPTSLLAVASNVSSDPLSPTSSIAKCILIDHSFVTALDSKTKPSEKPQLEKHIILTEDTQRYVKSDGEWLEYNKCIGFRYNISGAFTRLKSYICLMEEGGTCQVQVVSNSIIL